MPPQQTWLLPSSDASWPEVKRWLSAALDAAGEQDLCSAWQFLHEAARCIRHSQRQAGSPVHGFGAVAATAGSDDTPAGPATMPGGAWLDCAGGEPQQAALANVIRSALDLDSAQPAAIPMPIDGTFGGCGGSSCRLPASLTRSLVACSLLGLLLPSSPCVSEEQQQQKEKERACSSSDSCWQQKQQQQSLIPCSSWSRALMHIFSRSVSAADAQDCTDVVVTRTAKSSFVTQQPLTLDEWCHQEAPLCSVLVTSISDAAAAVTTTAGPGDDVCLELTAASLLQMQLPPPGMPPAEGELLRIARGPPTGGRTMQEHDSAARLHDDLLAVSQGDLRWLTDYQQHKCTSADCCADCHILWQLAMTYVRVAGLVVTAAETGETTYAADTAQRSARTTSGMSCSQRCEAGVHVGESSYRRCSGGDGVIGTAAVCRLAAPTDHQHLDAAEPVECAIRLHSTTRLRSPALVAPAIVVYESTSDATDQGTVTAWDGCASGACTDDGSCYSSAPPSSLPSASCSSPSPSSVAFDHRDTSVTAFADALAASLLGDALTCRPLPTRSESAERRPSMPTIVEEALGSGSSCCTGPSVCCIRGTNDSSGGVLTAAAASVAAISAPACASVDAKPLCDFADRLAADVLRDALRVTRSDSLPPDDLCVDCDRPLSPPASTPFARCGSVSSEAAAGSVCSWQSLEDFSHGLLVSAIMEAKQEWFSRVAAVGGSLASDGSHDDGGGCDSDDDADHRATREHARFFQWEFLDRCGSTSPGGWPPAGGRRGSEPTGCAAAVTTSAAFERRGSAPCMSATKRSLAADRRPSDYFDDEFIRRLHGGSSSGSGEGGSRRGSAPPMHGCRADQSDDDYFAAEFSLAAHRNSASFVGGLTPVTADRSLTRAGDAASLAESSCCGPTIVGGYLSLYSDVLAENVMHSSFRELARRLAASTSPSGRCRDVGGSLAATPTAAAQPLSAIFTSPAAVTATSAVAGGVDGFAVWFAERLMNDVFSSLRSVPHHSQRSCELAVLGVPALAVGRLDDGYGNEASADDGVGESCAPDPDALALRRKSSGRRHSRTTVRGGPSPLPPPSAAHRAASVSMAASWECSSSGACDETHEQLSALLCWIASSVAGIRELNIHVSQGLLAEKLEAIVRQALSMQLKTGSMATLVLEYCRERQQQQGNTAQMPFAYISERM